eukprot:gene14341-30524_t
MTRNQDKEKDDVLFGKNNKNKKGEEDSEDESDNDSDNDVKKLKGQEKVNDDGGTIWGSGGLGDILAMIRNQMQRYRYIRRQQQLRRSGLTLLTNTNTNGLSSQQSMSYSLSRRGLGLGMKMSRADGSAHYPGVEKLSFARELSRAASAMFAGGGGDKSPMRNVNNNTNTPNQNQCETPEIDKPSTVIAADYINTRGTSMTINIKPSSPHHSRANNVSQSDMRYVTELSTRGNLKYVRIGGRGVQAIAKALVGDRIIESIVLSGGRVDCRGAEALGRVLPSIHTLTRLDLSRNGIADDGAVALSKGLALSRSIVSVTVMGNRITAIGASALVQTEMKSKSITYLNLLNNSMSPDERQGLLESTMGNTWSGKGNLKQTGKEKEQHMSDPFGESETITVTGNSNGNNGNGISGKGCLGPMDILAADSVDEMDGIDNDNDNASTFTFYFENKKVL